jgi:hypothetical protein
LNRLAVQSIARVLEHCGESLVAGALWLCWPVWESKRNSGVIEVSWGEVGINI